MVKRVLVGVVFLPLIILLVLFAPQWAFACFVALITGCACWELLHATAKLPQGVDTLIGPGGVYLSGGEQQRIAIARVILQDAPIVLMDEATAFADPDNESKVQAAFANLAQGKTVVMIAHRLSTVRNVDRIYVIRDGRVAEQGTYQDLMAQNGLFRQMWDNYQTAAQWKVAREEVQA